MISAKTLVVGLVGAGCMAAAGVGGYVAVRSGSASTSAAPAVAADSGPQAAPAAEIGYQPAAQTAPAPQDPGARESDARAPAAAQTAARRDLAARPVAPTAQRQPTQGVSNSRASGPIAQPQPPVTPSDPAPVDDAPAPPAGPPSEATARPAEPFRPDFDEVTIAGASVLGIRLETAVSSQTAHVEDRVTARVTRDVMVDGRTAIPSGARLEGNVALVERGGRFNQRPRIGIRFTTLIFADSTRVPVQTETIFRDGDAPGSESTSKIGASAVVGALLGAVIGGKKGAAIGGAAGAAGGTAAVMAGDPGNLTIAAGTPLTVRLTEPLTVVVDHQQ